MNTPLPQPTGAALWMNKGREKSTVTEKDGRGRPFCYNTVRMVVLRGVIPMAS